MKARRIISVLMALILLMTSLACLSTIPTTAAEATHGYVTDGLVSLYSGTRNQDGGHNASATVWQDIVGDNDLDVTGSEFNDLGLFMSADDHHNFPQAIVNLVNGQEFTVELFFDNFTSVGSAYNTFLNSKNDNFALYREVGADQIVFKFAANPGAERPRVNNALARLKNGLISVTYKVGGSCRIYMDGILCAEVPCNKAMGANDLFIGLAMDVKAYETTYRSMRFYNRELSEAEVAANAIADGFTLYETFETPYVDIAQPKTNIAGDIAMVREIDTAAELELVSNLKTPPAAVIVNVDSGLNIRANDGSQICTVDELIRKLEFKIFPVFRVSDSDTITKLSAFLSTVNFLDVMFISRDPALISEANRKFSVGRGVIDYTDKYKDKTSLTAEECMAIRAEMKINNAYVALLPAALCHKDTVQYLYDRQVAVWCATTAEPTVEEQYDALLSGAVGVVSDFTNDLLEIACALPENTMTRLPLNIGHRGIVSLAPENTIEGYLLAVEKGVDVVEIDVYMTKDKQLVVFHDETTGRLWNQNLTITSSTLDEQQALSLNASTAAQYPDFKDVRIPSFEECLQTLKDVDVQLFVEIKTADYSIPAAVRDLIKKYDLEDRCSVITFSGAQLQKMAEVWPEMSGGVLRLESYDGITNDAPEAGLIQAFGVIGPLGGTLNPQHLTQMKGNVIRESLLRGVLVYPYSYINNGYAEPFAWGYSGLTGDNPEVMGTYGKTLTVENLPDGTTIQAGERLKLDVLLTQYNGQNKKVSSGNKGLSMLVISGEEGASLIQPSWELTFENAGEYQLAITYTEKISSARVTYVSDVITVKVTPGEQETEIPTEEITEPVEIPTEAPTTEVTEAPSEEQTDALAEGKTDAPESTTKGEEQSDKGCGSLVAGSAVVIMAVAAAFVLKKKEN